MMNFLRILPSVVAICSVLAIDHVAFAQQTDSVQRPLAQNNLPPYETRLYRVAELVGSLHYLNNLCGTVENNRLRETLQKVITAETANEPARRRQLVSRYNKGYRTFASVYTSCTDAAKTLEAQYRQEGRDLVIELLARYTN